MQDQRNNKKPNKMKRRYQKSVLLKSKVNAAIIRTDMHCTALHSSDPKRARERDRAQKMKKHFIMQSKSKSEINASKNTTRIPCKEAQTKDSQAPATMSRAQFPRWFTLWQ